MFYLNNYLLRALGMILLMKLALSSSQALLGVPHIAYAASSLQPGTFSPWRLPVLGGLFRAL